jgi:uncharacterized protein
LVMLTEDIKESLLNIKTIYLATCSADGIPNVAPMGAFKLLDSETILISDQYMNKTLKNVISNPHAAISYWGEKGGFQIKGTVSVHTDDQVFRDNVAWMKTCMPRLTPKGALLMKITDVFMVKPGPEPGKKIL